MEAPGWRVRGQPGLQGDKIINNSPGTVPGSTAMSLSIHTPVCGGERSGFFTLGEGKRQARTQNPQAPPAELRFHPFHCPEKLMILNPSPPPPITLQIPVSSRTASPNTGPCSSDMPPFSARLGSCASCVCPSSLPPAPHLLILP